MIERPAVDAEAEGAASVTPRRKVSRNPLTWYRGGGLWNLVFLAPMLMSEVKRGKGSTRRWRICRS